MILVLLMLTSGLASAGKSWANKQDHHHHGNHVYGGVATQQSHLKRLDVVCSKDYMTVNMQFDGPFYGVVFSHPSSHHERCIHVGPRAGVQDVTFHIKYDGCGTVEDLRGQFHENTIVIQFGEDILEAWDEAKRLRCEWLESFEKPSSKPTLSISELDIVELNFQGDDIDCWMEIQEGKGPWARQVGGLVPIGSPLTLVIAINDNSKEFDMRVKKCSASDGSGSEIQLTDYDGCVIRPSLLTPFVKVRDFGGKATLVAYSHIYAFKFPDTLDVLVHCIVEVCRHGCPDSCGGKVLEDYHSHSGDYISLESKKYQKLVELANSKPSSVHHLHTSHLHQAASSKTEHYVQPLPGRERNKGILNEESKQQLLQAFVKNISLIADSSEKHATSYSTKTFDSFTPPSPPKHGSFPSEENTKLHSSPSNIHLVLADIKNNIHNVHTETHVNSKVFSHHNPFYQEKHDDKSLPVGTLHKIIGHDAHWDSGANTQIKDSIKHEVPDLTSISYIPPKPEPSAWTADEVKPLRKQDVFHRPSFNPHQYKDPKPEPSAWTADEVKPLSKEEIFHKPSFNPHQYKDPKPEPSAWTADEVKPLSKEEVFHKPSFNPHQFGSPKPERIPWTYEEVNPMHSPLSFKSALEKVPLQEPKTEPAAWSLDDVKPLTKEDLRAISLNHKLKTNPHLSIPLPIYKEHVAPFSSTTIPQPVFPGYTKNPQNMSSPMMMNMMMMMPTLLPYTYQTARWPQKTTARFLGTPRHHYPYPIPQFSPRQQLMKSVIADRRMDGDESEADTIAATQHRMDSVRIDPRSRIPIGGTLSDITISDNEEKAIHNKDHKDEAIPSDSTTQTAEDNDDHTKIVSTGLQLTPAITKTNDRLEARLPIEGFVPPSFDEELLESHPQIKDGLTHIPRSLNRRKRSDPVFGVRQKFQAIALSDLAFDLNLTTDSTATLRGRREEVVYGICMSQASISASVGLILILTLCALIASAILYEHSCRLSNKTSHLSVLTRTFNGRFESLYRITRNKSKSRCRDTG